MVDSGFLVNSVLNMLLVVRLPSLVTESEIRVPSHLCGGDFGCASGVQKGTLLYARPGWGGLSGLTAVTVFAYPSTRRILRGVPGTMYCQQAPGFVLVPWIGKSSVTLA